MKKRLKLNWLWLTVLAMLTLLPAAHAYYDSAAQRWVNRDPIMENGGMNLFGFVINNPINLRDWFGHDFGQVACDGNGNWAAFYPPNQKGSNQSCSEQHEKSHLGDLNTLFPNACKNAKKGENPLADDAHREFWCDSECKAHQKSVACHKAEACKPGLTSEEKQKEEDYAYASELAGKSFCNKEECQKKKPAAYQPPPADWIIR